MNAPVTPPISGCKVADQAEPSRHHGNQPPPTGTTRANLVKGLAIPLLAVVSALAGVGYATTSWNRWAGLAATQTTDDAQIRAETSRIASRISGTVLNIAVGDFQKVRAGELLAEIDPASYEVEVERAQANVAAAEATLANADNQIALQRAIIDQAQASRASSVAKEMEARQERERQDALLPTGSGTKKNADLAMTSYAAAQANLLAAEAAIKAQERQLDVLFGNKRRMAAQLGAARAALDAAKLQLSYTRIVAPVEGVVGERIAQVGNYVALGTGLISIVPVPDVHIIANFKETQLANMSVGQMVDFTVDALPGSRFSGRVERISPASGSQFALLPPDNATGNFTKVVQRIPVRISIQHGQPGIERLRPGMSVIASINTGRSKPGASP